MLARSAAARIENRAGSTRDPCGGPIACTIDTGHRSKSSPAVWIGGRDSCLCRSQRRRARLRRNRVETGPGKHPCEAGAHLILSASEGPGNARAPRPVRPTGTGSTAVEAAMQAKGAGLFRGQNERRDLGSAPPSSRSRAGFPHPRPGSKPRISRGTCMATEDPAANHAGRLLAGFKVGKCPRRAGTGRDPHGWAVDGRAFDALRRRPDE